MKRKMTFLARAGKCGALGASDFSSLLSAPKSLSESSEARAMEPSPIPQRLKTCRRVKLLNCSVDVCNFIRELWSHPDSASHGQRLSRLPVPAWCARHVVL